MYTLFLTTLTNEIIGLLPITVIQIGYLTINHLNTAEVVWSQVVISLAFAIGNFVLYFLGKYGSIPLLKIFNKYKLFSSNKDYYQINSPKFYWIIVMRAIPFFPAKHVSIGLGVLKYNIPLFFISSWVGIFIRGMILYFLFKIGIMLSY